jgi:hypothetical protein
MEPEGLSSRLQEPVTCPYPEPEQYSPYTPIPILGDPSQYYPISMPGSSKWFLSLRYPHQNAIAMAINLSFFQIILNKK